MCYFVCLSGQGYLFLILFVSMLHPVGLYFVDLVVLVDVLVGALVDVLVDALVVAFG